MWVKILFFAEMILVGICMSVFYGSCLTPKYSPQKTFLAGNIVFAALNMILVPMEVTFLGPLLTIIVEICFIFCGFREKKKVKVLVLMLGFSAMYISELVFTGLWYAVGWDKLIPFGDTAISEVRVMMNLLVVLIFWSVSGLFIFIWNRTKQKQLSVVGLQIVLPCLIVQNLLTACFLMIQGAGDVSGCVNILEGIFIFCECALIYYEMFFTRKKELLAEEVKTMEEKIVFNTKFYDESLERYQKMREMRHDTKNYLQTLEYLVEVEPEEAEKMLEILKKRITE